MAVVMYSQYYIVRTQDLSKDGKGIEVTPVFMFFATYYVMLQILPIVSSDLACC